MPHFFYEIVCNTPVFIKKYYFKKEHLFYLKMCGILDLLEGEIKGYVSDRCIR